MNYHDIFVRNEITVCDINKLEKYMFFHLPQIQHKSESLETTIVSETHKTETHTIESVNQKDVLFWIMYIHVYSKEQYDTLTKYTNTQMDEKRKYADFFIKMPNVMKNVNMKMTKNNIQENISDFMTNSDITIDSLLIK